jgi:hypothetical protein
MSNKSKLRKKKAAKAEKAKAKAKVKLLHTTRIAPKTHFVALEVQHSEEPPAELSSWSKFSKWMGWS